MDISEIKKEAIYWCRKCERIHKNHNTQIFKKHLEFLSVISLYEFQMIQFRKNWERCKKEQEKYGAVNLPKKRLNINK